MLWSPFRLDDSFSPASSDGVLLFSEAQRRTLVGEQVYSNREFFSQPLFFDFSLNPPERRTLSSGRSEGSENYNFSLSSWAEFLAPYGLTSSPGRLSLCRTLEDIADPFGMFTRTSGTFAYGSIRRAEGPQSPPFWLRPWLIAKLLHLRGG